jgi:hypothetical protein
MAKAKPDTADSSTTKKSVNIQPRSNCVHSQLVAVSAVRVPRVLSQNVAAAQAQADTFVPVAIPTERDKGSQKTLNP